MTHLADPNDIPTSTFMGDPNLQVRLSDAATYMECGLSLTTGLGPIERKIVSKYTLSTHAIRDQNSSSLLAAKGPPGTGKSTLLVVTHGFSYRPRLFSAKNKTLAVFRDELAACHEGTAIIEEADALWRDASVENLLLGRCQRGTATAGKKVKTGDDWIDDKKPMFGATILHRRNPFSDVALNARSITVRTRFDPSRDYEAVSALRLPESELSEEGWEEWWAKAAWWAVEGRKLVTDLTFKLPTLKCPIGIAPRVFDTYAPLVATAQLCGDDEFLQEIMPRLQRDTEQLKGDQSTEFDGQVVRALIQRLCNGQGGSLNLSQNVALKDIAGAIYDAERTPVRPHQVGAALRDLGFKTKESHGLTKIVCITPATLIVACDEVGYEGEEIIKLRNEIQNR
jgi:hypothetical protein